MRIDKLKDLIQSCHINFMLGSGISRPYLSTLGNIEILLTDLSNRKEKDDDILDRIKASIYKVYFSEVMWPNYPQYVYVNNEENDTQLRKGTLLSYNHTLNNYKSFLTLLNEILLFRYSDKCLLKINDVFSAEIIKHFR